MSPKESSTEGKVQPRKNSSVCSSLFPRIAPRQASTTTSNPLAQPFPPAPPSDHPLFPRLSRCGRGAPGWRGRASFSLALFQALKGLRPLPATSR